MTTYRGSDADLRPAARFDVDDVIRAARPRPRKVRPALRDLLGAVTLALVAIAAVTADGMTDQQLFMMAGALFGTAFVWGVLTWRTR